MGLKQPQFVNGEIYHIVNRGVEKRNIFQQISDYFRFIFCLHECNNENPVVMRDRLDECKKYIGKSIGDTYEGRGSSEKIKKKPLVEIMAFCLMPNHFHLAVRQVKEGGISLFMKKLGDSYVGYFNKKHQRVGMGSLFQGSFKAVHIKTTNQLINVICYIFTNPVELLEKNWKETGVKNFKKAIQYLNTYRWSSYLDYIEKKNFPLVSQRDFIFRVFGGSGNIKKFVEIRILSKTEMNKTLDDVKTLTLETPS